MAQSRPYTHARLSGLRPVDIGGPPPVKFEPINKARPTIKDVVGLCEQLHECHEDTKAKVENIQLALGITPGGKRVAGLSTPWKAFIRSAGATATAIGGLILFYRLAVAAWPTVWQFVSAFNHVILTGKF